MKNKGLILFFTILIALVCIYCLSFSFASWRVENKAAKFANDPTAIEEVKKAAITSQNVWKFIKRHSAS